MDDEVDSSVSGVGSNGSSVASRQTASVPMNSSGSAVDDSIAMVVDSIPMEEPMEEPMGGVAVVVVDGESHLHFRETFGCVTRGGVGVK